MEILFEDLLRPKPGEIVGDPFARETGLEDFLSGINSNFYFIFLFLLIFIQFCDLY